MTAAPPTLPALACEYNSKDWPPRLLWGQIKRGTDAWSARAAVNAPALKHTTPLDGGKARMSINLGRGLKEDTAIITGGMVRACTLVGAPPSLAGSLVCMACRTDVCCRHLQCAAQVI